MMPVLGFDCSMRALSAAVRVGDGRVVARFELCETGQAELLLPMIEAVMSEAGVAFSDLKQIAVTLGPGGFTGVRVGLSAARGFGLAAQVPVVGMSSLELIARDAAEHVDLPADARLIAVVASAGRDGFYRQIFAVRPFEVVGAPELILPGELERDVAGAVLVGPAAYAYRDQLLPAMRVTAALDGLQPRAARLIDSISPLTSNTELRPIYLRAADAKPQVGRALPRAVE